MKKDEIYLQRCLECDSVVSIAKDLPNQTACCPNCNEVLQSGNRWSLRRCAIIALSILILLPFGLWLPLMNIDLLGVPIYASVWGGVWKMATEGFPYTAFMIFLCSVIMPFAFAGLVLLIFIQRLIHHRPRYTLILLSKAKQWVMLDVYLVAIAVAAFKVREYAKLEFDYYIIAFIMTAILTTLLFIKIDPKRWWERFYPEYHTLPADYPCQPSICSACEYTFDENIVDKKGRHRCPRCESNLDVSDSIKLQRVWATLIAGAVMMIPANLLPISSTEFAGTTSADTLMGGVILFMEMGSYLIAAIIFIASIAVPFSKVAVIFYLLLAIHYRWKHPIHWQMKLLHYVHFVGRWSMLDLFVLALMMSLVERGQIISFSVGEAAFYFGAAVFLTMISSSNIDTRMLWRIHREHNTTQQSG
ncbi:paraquat-inducible protein A [Glaesserella parasuis]|uniref:PqiA/YebS family transporter subunit n=1 Tax=Glaesserella parasuis TaxID=738 RepID=UPI0013666B87|nr:paraquat-inducible protein A [Glaesserella parasuis]MDG6241262.1 paraquat-inducible protein A [Glaesserella parasuis]MDG6294495.1 paraquat-inducible protein A [Glaesserella parasuis]MDG6790888.1 paraquat-inducible protein A [Glaesserella parasuis]MDO9818369.1 paraquat-inducible protein A [Glaesserella parasuis]MDO9828974.1 paraquat-inducible protein A [Glaesserella parasuis]